MADYDLKYTGAQIDALLDTANELQSNGYIYKGVATPSTNPGTPTERVAYLASEPGTYTNFGGLLITGLSVLTYNGSAWSASQLNLNIRLGETDFDFAIADENGNAIVIFENGHIKTKNFNSANNAAAQFLTSKFTNKKIAIIGDSISTYNGWLPSAYPTYYPAGDVNSVEKTWWYQVAINLGIKTTDIANTSWSGSTVCGNSTSTTSGVAACSTKRISDMAIHGFIPDIILIYIGCNDWYQCGLSGYNIILGTWAITDAVPAEGTINAFRSAYALMLAKIQTTYPSARIFCCTILDDWRRDETADDPTDNAWPSNDGAGYTTKQWNDNIKEIADAFACDVIDMHNCGITYFNIQNYAVDAGLHPNAAGHAMMARKVTSELMAKY